MPGLLAPPVEKKASGYTTLGTSTEVSSKVCANPDDPGIFVIFKSLFWTIYVPVFIFTVGSTIALPTLPLYAESLGLKGSLLGLAIASAGLGRICTNMVSGRMVVHFGVRLSMIASFLFASAGALLTFCAVDFWSLVLGLFIFGFGQSLDVIARMSYMKRVVADEHRGRIVAGLGGVYRIASVLGSLIGGFTAETYGLRIPYILQIPLYLLGVAICAVVYPRAKNEALPSETQHGSDAGSRCTKSGPDANVTYLTVIGRHWRVLASAGGAMFFLSLLRASRAIIIPLHGNQVGLTHYQIGIILATSFALDSALFAIAGVISDSYGRKKAGLPGFAFLSAGLLTTAAITSFIPFVLAGILMGCGNGFTSGLIMTTGTDVAPPHPEDGPFLGMYAILFDLGDTLAPFVIAVVGRAANYRTSSAVVSFIGVIGTLWYLCFVAETRWKNKATVQHEFELSSTTDAADANISQEDGMTIEISEAQLETPRTATIFGNVGAGEISEDQSVIVAK